MSESAIVVSTEYRELGPALTVAEVTNRYRQMTEFASSVMREGVDYGRIPGTGEKPSLFKPGAEKLSVFFGLEARFTLADRQERWDVEPPFFYYRYECALYHRESGGRVANAFGSCNSREKKYRFRHVPEFKATEEEKAAAVSREQRRSKGGNVWYLLTIPNADICDLVNTFDKMAQKRALVAAILVGTGASEFFTQDIEDLAIFEEETTEMPPSAPRPQPKAQPAEAGNGAVSPQEWLTKHGKIIFECKREHSYLQPLQIAERLSTLNVDPTGGTEAALAALAGETTAPPSPAAEAPVATGDAAWDWFKDLQTKMAAAQSERAPSEKQVGFAASLLGSCWPNAANQEAQDLRRHQFMALLVGLPSLKELNFAQMRLLLDELTTKDDGGKSVLDDTIAGYVRTVVQAQDTANGQAALPFMENAEELPF